MKSKNITTLFATLLICGVTADMTMSANAAVATDKTHERSFFFFKKKDKKQNATSEKNDSTKSSASGYAKLTSDGASVSEGLFKVISKKGDYWFEIPRTLMGRDMLVVNKFTKVPAELNEAGANRGLNFSNQMVRFELDSVAGKVTVRQSRPLPTIKSTDAMARSVADNYISPIIAKFKIETYNSDSTAVVVKVNDIYDGTSTSFNNVFNDLNIGSSPNKELSAIKSMKAFDNNIYAVSELTTKVVEPGGTVYVTVEVGSSLLLLPEKPMTRRYVSPKVGYFTEDLIRFGDTQQRTAKEHYITRWRLEPKPEDVSAYLAGQLVEPQKPIIFWIDPATPQQWRKYIRQGIEDWNPVFEGAGFKNAIQVREIADTDSIDMDDVNYSVLTYAASTKSNAMGPSITDPRSGEILEADIMWWHNVVDILSEWIVVQTGAVDPRARQSQLPDDLMGDAMRFVACHEVGHSLGLRHNMIASACVPTEQLRNPEYMEKFGGTSASIMDYARFNYVAQPGDGVKDLAPHIGPYDRMAIEYGYRWFGKNTPDDETPLLVDLINRHKGDEYRFSEAQDSRDAVDPRALSEDLGDNALKSAAYGIANLKRIVPNIVKWTTTGEPAQDYDDASRLYFGVIGQWQRYAYHVLANIGGIYMENTEVGDGKQTFRHVDKARQRESVKFLVDEYFTYPEWLFNADLTNYTYLITNTPYGRVEVSPNLQLKNIQSFVLWDMINDNRLVRMYENEAINGDRAFKASDMMDMLVKGIFRTTLSGGNPGVRERAGEKNFVDLLITASTEGQGIKDNAAKKLREDANLTLPAELGCFHAHDNHAAGEHPATGRQLNFYGSQSNRISDAISLRRGTLLEIRDLLNRRVRSSKGDVRNHYMDMLMRINTGLGLDKHNTSVMSR